MGWAVGRDHDRQRHIGYGVPATCDYPDCGKDIDRGIAYACGGGVTGTVENCGLYFCGEHLTDWLDDDTDGGENVCERCAADQPPFDPSPDTQEWIEHVLTDDSWAQWRADEPAWVERLRAQIGGAR